MLRNSRVLWFTVVVLLASCADLLSEYHGPYPDRTDIVNEVAVVRRTTPAPVNGTVVLVADRTRFTVGGDPHNVNRIVELNAYEVNAEAAALQLAPGDTIRFSSRYTYTHLNAFPEAIPDWPGHHQPAYPVAYHTLTAISR